MEAKNYPYGKDAVGLKEMCGASIEWLVWQSISRTFPTCPMTAASLYTGSGTLEYDIIQMQIADLFKYLYKDYEYGDQRVQEFYNKLIELIRIVVSTSSYTSTKIIEAMGGQSYIDWDGSGNQFEDGIRKLIGE